MSRKRAAPGAEPQGSSSYPQIQSNWTSVSTMDQQGGYSDTSDFAINPYQNTMPQLQREPSNQLTRRGTNQLELAQYGNSNWPVQQYQAQQANNSVETNWQNDDDELERKAEIAERNAAINRKPIPPFVRKLRSFVDDKKNADLIRWSEDGRSFIVLDEDEFAKKLIPELFKHNKYPSFVRQLNMYGFHKKVALSDNSMRASERKSKSPSEYYNPYFRQDHPNFMWLIQKPKAGQSGKKNSNGEDIDDDEFDGEAVGPSGGSRNRQSVVLPSGQRVLSQEMAVQLHDELSAIRQNQTRIQEEVRKLREENDLMQNRAAAYQAIHQRHENSINAILTFLATVFRNQIEGRDASSLAGLFPQPNSRDQQQGDRVVDLADFDSREPSVATTSGRPTRRPLLLEAPAAGATPTTDGSHSRVQSVSTPTSTDFHPRDTSSAPPPSSTPGATEIKRENSIDAAPSEDILSFLTSQTSGPTGNINRLDYPQALSQLQSANRRSPMSTPQRNDLLRLMANGQAANVLNGNGNNALTSPSPPPIPGPSDPQWEARSKEIEALERSIREQDDRFNSVTQLLGPLSPSGSISFLDGDGNVPPPDFDLDWLNANPEGNAMGVLDNDNPFFDFKDFDANNNGDGLGVRNGDGGSSVHGRVVGTAENSEAASPAGTINTIEDNNDSAEALDPPSKRQRVS